MVAVRVGHHRRREKAEAERQERRPLRKRQACGVGQEADQRKPGSQAGPGWRELGVHGEREFNLADERTQRFCLPAPVDHCVLVQAAVEEMVSSGGLWGCLGLAPSLCSPSAFPCVWHTVGAQCTLADQIVKLIASALSEKSSSCRGRGDGSYGGEGGVKR